MHTDASYAKAYCSCKAIKPVYRVDGFVAISEKFQETSKGLKYKSGNLCKK